METTEAIKSRFSIRQYLDKDVSDELINKIIEYAKLAPSAGNLQAYKVVVIRNDEIKKTICSISAPVILVICCLPEVSGERYGDRGRKLYCIQDATIFASYIQLAAIDLGLASAWVGAFRERKVKEILGLNEGIRPIALIPLGFPAVKKDKKRRRRLEEIIISEK